MRFLLQHYTQVPHSYQRGMELVWKFKYIVLNPKWNGRKKMRGNKDGWNLFLQRCKTRCSFTMYHKVGSDVRFRIQVSMLACYFLHNVWYSADNIFQACFFLCFIIFTEFFARNVWSDKRIILSACFTSQITKRRSIKLPEQFNCGQWQCNIIPNLHET
jgi:hypothetical protein